MCVLKIVYLLNKTKAYKDILKEIFGSWLSISEQITA